MPPLLQGGEYPVRALNATEEEIVLDQICTRVRSGTAQIFIDNPLLRQPFWDEPCFWEGKWRAGHFGDLLEWVDLHGGWVRMFDGQRVEEYAEGEKEEAEEETNTESYDTTCRKKLALLSVVGAWFECSCLYDGYWKHMH